MLMFLSRLCFIILQYGIWEAEITEQIIDYLQELLAMVCNKKLKISLSVNRRFLPVPFVELGNHVDWNTRFKSRVRMYT